MTDQLQPPHPGDVIRVNFSPSAGHEQSGKRPAIVVSTHGYNALSNCIIVCPVTRNMSPWPFKVFLPAGLTIEGAILVDQVKSIDWRERFVRAEGRIPDDVLAEVRKRLVYLFNPPLT